MYLVLVVIRSVELLHVLQFPVMDDSPILHRGYVSKSFWFKIKIQSYIPCPRHSC